MRYIIFLLVFVSLSFCNTQHTDPIKIAFDNYFIRIADDTTGYEFIEYEFYNRNDTMVIYKDDRNTATGIFDNNRFDRIKIDKLIETHDSITLVPIIVGFRSKSINLKKDSNLSSNSLYEAIVYYCLEGDFIVGDPYHQIYAPQYIQY